MKQLLLIISLCILQACQQATNTAEERKVTTHQAKEQPVAVLTENTKIVEKDTLLKLAVNSSPAPQSEKIDRKNLIEQLRNLEEERIEPSEAMLPLLALAGQTVAESTAFLFFINQDTLKLYVDYFEGDLIGSKIFYVARGDLLAVDVFTMDAYETESGPQVQSLLTHTFYYQKEKLLFCKVHHNTHKQAILEEENLQDWAIIQQHLQSF